MSIASRIESMTEHLTNNWNIVNSLGLHTNKLPKEYTQVDYIESSGTQYIDTGVIPIDSTSIETKVKITDMTQARNYVCGCYSINTSNRFQLSFLGDVVDRNIMWCRGNAVSRAYVTPSQNNLYKIKTNEADLIINEQSIVSSFGSFDDQAISIFLFGNNSNGNVSSLSNGEKMYYFKIYNNNVLVRDFIPCYRNSDNEVGLYDIVNDIFYTNQGTGVFTYGQIQEEYIDRNLENLKLPLNRFYNDVSDKTDISENGVVGRTSQETTTGKNYFEASSSNFPQGLTITNNTTTGEITFSGTTTGSYPTLSNFTDANVPAGEYTFSIDKTLPYNITLRFRNASGQYPTFITIPSGSLYNTITTSYDAVRLEIVYHINSSGITVPTTTIKPMLESGSTATDFEPYTGEQPSPNPDYPQPINNLSGDVPYKVSGKNLFDISKVERNVYYNYGTAGSVPTIATSDKRITLSPTNSIKVKPSTQYTLSFPSAFRYAIAEMENNYISLGDSGWKTNTTYTFTTSATTNYIGFNFSKTDNSTITDNDWDTFINSGIQLEKGSTATDFEPYISQTFNIPLKSKNLANLDIIGRAPSVSNGQMVDLPAAVSSDFIEVDNTKEYIFQYNFSGTNERYIFFYDEDKKFISSTSGENNVPSGVHINSFISFSRSKYIKLRVDKQSNINWVQLEESSTPTDYEPYYDIELCKIDNYQDRIYKQNDKWYLEKNINKVIYDGSKDENWNINTSSGYYRSQIPINDIYEYTDTSRHIDKILCSNFYLSTTDAIGIIIQFKKQILFYVPNGITTIGEWRTWLSTHNTTVYYVLATPTTTEITQENYPLLYNALKQIQDYLTSYKINKEFILGYSSPEIEY